MFSVHDRLNSSYQNFVCRPRRWAFSYWKTEGALGLSVFKKFYVIPPFVFCRMPLSNSTSSNKAAPIQPLMNNSCALNVGNAGPPPPQYLPIFVNSCITYNLKPITVPSRPPSIPESIDITDPKFANDPRIQKHCIGQTGPAMACGFVEANFYSANISEPSFVQIKREFTDPGIPDDPRLQNHCMGETKTSPGVLFTQIKQEFVEEKSSSVTSLTDRNEYESCKSENESRDTSTALLSRTTNCTDEIKSEFGYADGTNPACIKQEIYAEEACNKEKDDSMLSAVQIVAHNLPSPSPSFQARHTMLSSFMQAPCRTSENRPVRSKSASSLQHNVESVWCYRLNYIVSPF